MTTTTTGTGNLPRQTAAGQRSGCASCATAEEPDLRAAVVHLSTRFTEAADVLARYMAGAGLKRGERTALAGDMAARLARIVGGVETPGGKYPDCALIGRKAPNGALRWFCSGALVHPRVVLTAAHCQDPLASINVVALDALDVQHLDDAEIIAIRRVRVNPRYPLVLGHDISVLILRRAARTTPVPLTQPEGLAAAQETTLVGFGNSDLFSTKGFGRQREVTVDITNVRRTENDDLDDAEEALGFESDLEFTAGGGGFDSCNGDSGGPAYIDVGGERMLAGLTSRATEGFSTPCGDGGIYTRVDTQREFINQVLDDAGIDDEL